MAQRDPADIARIAELEAKLAWALERIAVLEAKVEQLTAQLGLEWITALKSAQIRELVEGGHLQLGLFDERSLFEIGHPDYPGERLVACRNPELAKLRGRKRKSLLDATVKDLEQVRGMVERGTLRTQAEIGLRVGRVINKYKVAKHFALDIGEGHFAYRVLEDQVAAEAKLDGIYVIRTSIAQKHMTAEDAVRNYKLLSNVERAFRSMKTIDLKVRPIHHRLEDRVRSHIFLCMLAYYVEWHMREAWRPLLFADEDQAAKKTRDPVAPAKRSDEATVKALSHRLSDGTPAHSFQSLMDVLATVVRNTCRTPGSDDDSATFALVTTPSPIQQRAISLLEAIAP